MTSASAPMPARVQEAMGSPAAGRFADALRSGRCLLGTVVSSSDPLLAERIAGAFDFVWIDLEHSALTVRDAQMLAIAVQAAGAAALVRLPGVDSDLLGAVLDAGVDGIVAPKVESALEAASLVRTTRYPPRGVRGFAPRRASKGRAALGPGRTTADPVCIAQIETRQGLATASEIAAVDGIDGVVVGTADLSFDLGAPLNMASNELKAAVEAVGQAAASCDTAWGVAIGELPEWVRDVRARGGSLLVFGSDSRIYAEAVANCSELLRHWQAPAEVPETDGANS